MSQSVKKKLIAANAALLAVAAVVSLVLPMVLKSITDGHSEFLAAGAHVAPIFVAIPISCSLLGKAFGSSAQ